MTGPQTIAWTVRTLIPTMREFAYLPPLKGQLYVCGGPLLQRNGSQVAVFYDAPGRTALCWRLGEEVPVGELVVEGPDGAGGWCGDGECEGGSQQ